MQFPVYGTYGQYFDNTEDENIDEEKKIEKDEKDKILQVIKMGSYIYQKELIILCGCFI